MKHASKVSAGLVALGFFAAHPAGAQPGEFIHSTVFARAGLSPDAIEKMVSRRVLVKAANDCYAINPSLLGKTRFDVESEQFVAQLRVWAGETTQVRICDIDAMRPGTQDVEPITE